MISLLARRHAAVFGSWVISLFAPIASAALGRKLVALLVSAILCAYTYDVIAAAPFEPPDFEPPANLPSRSTSFPEPARATEPPLPTFGSVRRGPLGTAEPEGFGGGASTQALNTSLPTAVGRIAGSYAVSETGNATYTIPIWTPPGARGIEPHLALVYASGTPDSLLGPGWSLSGLSGIARCIRTSAQDGTPGPVTLTMSDKFCLDGNRLRSTGGSYGADNSTYQTEIETFSKVIAHGATGNGPTWFEVKGKDGLTYEYGNTSDSRVLPTGSSTPYLWALNKVRDRQGNNMVISYLQTNGSFRPISIEYTRSPSTTLYTVTFGYINRATGTNLNSYIGGSKVQQQMLLSSVASLTGTGALPGSLIRQYNLDYTTAPATQRGRLWAVQECTAVDCLPPTTIAYQNGQAGLPITATSAGTGAISRVNTVDINGDGRMDLVYSTFSGSNHTWWVQFATSTGFGAAVPTGVVTSSTDPVLFDDFDANGSVDVLAPSSNVWWVLRWTGSAFTWTSTSTSVDPHAFVSADVNGDGLPDLVSTVWAGVDTKLYSRLNTTVAGGVSFASTTTVTNSPFVTSVWGNNSNPRSSVRYMDFNGDLRQDVIVMHSYPGGGRAVVPLISEGGTFANAGFSAQGGNIAPLPLQWNDDACTDFHYNLAVRIAPCNNVSSVDLPVNGVLEVLAVVDWNGDGRTDLLANSGGTLQVYRSTGDGVAAPAPTGIPTGSGGWNAFDQNGDGLGDLAFVNSSDVTYRLHNGANVMPDLATSIIDGFGMNVSFSYSSMSAWSSCYVRDSGPPAFPSSAFAGPIYVACALTASDGTGGTYQISNFYYNSNLHLQGRGWLGFERRYAIDSRDGIVNMDVYSQAFPHIGMTLYSLARQSDWTTRIREISHTLDSLPFGSGNDSRSFPYVRQSGDDAFEVGGNLNGQWITRTVTTAAVDSYGNPTTVTTSVVDMSTASSWYGETFTTQTVNAITNDPANWCLGLPTTTTVTSILPDSTSQTRTTAAAVDYVSCRVTQEMIEPPSTTLRVTTTYGFDSCGNVTLVSAVGKNPDGTDMPARTTTSNFGTRCQFAETTTNALNQTTQRTFNYALGLVSSETDPNGIGVISHYDGYGRKIQENRPDGTITTWAFTQCDAANGYCGVADLRWYISQYDYDTTGAQIRYKQLFHDGFNRPRYDARQNLAGTGTWHAVIGYDARGNEWYRYNPYISSNNGYTSFTYDLLNRPIVAALYNSSGAWDRQSLIAYVGRAVTFTDPKGNVSAKYFNVRGNLRQVVDPAPGGPTNYTWDHFGNLLTTTDPIGAGSSATYDIRGFKRTSDDADAGPWSYTPNSLGEVVSQLDANERTTTIEYDKLGRMTSRAEFEGTSTFTFGTSAAAKNIGKLQSVSGPGYSESFTYDPIGRPATTTFNADTTYQVDYAYNASTGFLDNVTYPSSTTGYRLRAQYLYANGILNQVRDYNVPDTVWWQLNAEDARGNPIDEQFENGVHALSNFDDLTGHLNWRMSGNSAQFNNHQNLTFEWDKNENLDKRIDVNQSNLTERFFYDALDRLDYSTLNGPVNLDVGLDAAGNILSKTSTTEPLSNVGTYTYHPVKRHAVSTTSNGWSFTYDANGNMLTGRGATITWFSYNLPSTITNGSLTSQFSYTPDRRYWRQNANYGSGVENTIYIGGLLEKVSSASGIEYRHMIRAGTATVIVSRHTSGANNTYYATQDHLGSTSVITNSSGAVVVSQNFGAYGNRRGSNWQGSPSAPDGAGIASTTRRGYTGHTMVDNLTLIHMNGRMYDPLIARFLSPDPIVQTLHLSQALNPYSYVMNNPLKYIDPSGYSWLSKTWKKVRKYLNPLNSSHHKVASFGMIAPVLVGTAFSPAVNAAASTWYSNTLNDRLMLKYPALQPVALIAACYWGGPFGCAGANMHLTRLNGGSTSDILMAGVTSYAGSAVSAYYGGVLSWESVAANSVTAGVSAELRGGNFMDGFKYALASSAASWLYQEFSKGYDLTWGRGYGHVDKSLRTDGAQGNYSHWGKSWASKFDKTDPTWFEETGWLSNQMNRIPGMNAVAVWHDNVVASLARLDSFGTVSYYALFVPTMPVAVATTYLTLMRPDVAATLAIPRGQ